MMVFEGHQNFFIYKKFFSHLFPWIKMPLPFLLSTVYSTCEIYSSGRNYRSISAHAQSVVCVRQVSSSLNSLEIFVPCVLSRKTSEKKLTLNTTNDCFIVERLLFVKLIILVTLPSAQNRQKNSLKECVFVNRHSKYSAMLSKIHSYNRLLFCPLGKSCRYYFFKNRRSSSHSNNKKQTS